VGPWGGKGEGNKRSNKKNEKRRQLNDSQPKGKKKESGDGKEGLKGSKLKTAKGTWRGGMDEKSTPQRMCMEGKRGNLPARKRGENKRKGNSAVENSKPGGTGGKQEGGKKGQGRPWGRKEQGKTTTTVMMGYNVDLVVQCALTKKKKKGKGETSPWHQ